MFLSLFVCLFFELQKNYKQVFIIFLDLWKGVALYED